MIYPELPDPKFVGEQIRFPYAKPRPVSHNIKHISETFDVRFYIYKASWGKTKLFWERIA